MAKKDLETSDEEVQQEQIAVQEPVLEPTVAPVQEPEAAPVDVQAALGEDQEGDSDERKRLRAFFKKLALEDPKRAEKELPDWLRQLTLY